MHTLPLSHAQAAAAAADTTAAAAGGGAGAEAGAANLAGPTSLGSHRGCRHHGGRGRRHASNGRGQSTTDYGGGGLPTMLPRKLHPAASYSEPVISYSDPFPAALPLTVITQRCSPGALLHLLDGKSVAQGAHLQGRLCSTARPDPLVPSAVGSPVNSGSKSSFSSSFSRRRCLDFLWRWTSSHCRRTSCT